VERVSQHISELLFDHDCVIVPALGGFLASNESARMLPNRVIYPPYRRIAFNVYLKQNDGLLANHLVETENISYSAANSILEEFTYECIQSLEQGKKVNIEQVGTLYFDHEKNIQFEAYRNINHRKDSFGMEPVHIIAVQHTNQEELRNTVIKPAKTIRVSEPGRRILITQKGKRFIGVAAALAAIVWFGTNLYLVAPNKNEASLNPFDSQTLVTTKPENSSPIISDSQSAVSMIDSQNIQHDTNLVANNVTVTHETTGTSVMPSSPELEPEVVTPKPPAAKPDEIKPVETKPIDIQTTGPRKYLIAGVFKIKENASGLLSKLQSAGFTNAEIIESNGLHYVSYSQVNTTEQAIFMSDSLKKNNYEGWVWKH
jgi:nucleoid DNA-binding protein